MSPHPCDRSALTEALFDGRLGPPEQASAERHIRVCPECAGLLGDLQATRDALRSASKAPLPLEHQRARLGLLRKAAAPPLPRRRPAWQIAAAITAAPMALLAASSLLGPSPRPGALPAPGSAPSASAAPGACADPQPGAGAPAPPRDDPPSSAPPSLPSPPPSAPLAGAPLAGAPPAPPAPRAASDARSHRASAPAAPASARPSSASREFAEAIDSLSRGDFSASAGKLEGFAAAHPRDARVEEALYLEAIALERAGRAADAKAAARRYLAAYPEGAHRAQARRIAGD